MAENEKDFPPSTKLVKFWTGEEEHHGFFVKDINKYVSGVNRWKDVSNGKWYNDNEINKWEYFTHYPKE